MFDLEELKNRMPLEAVMPIEHIELIRRFAVFLMEHWEELDDGDESELKKKFDVDAEGTKIGILLIISGAAHAAIDRILVLQKCAEAAGRRDLCSY